MKRILIFATLLFSCTLLFSNNIEDDFTTTSIPDPAFEQELINLGYDSGTIDGQVLTANISGVTNLYLSYLGITNLTGIEDFVALESLYFQDNTAIASIDLTSNTNLKTLNVLDFPSLASIDITGLTNLTDILLSNLVGITSLDFSNISSLDKIQISRLSNLSTINVTGLSNLQQFTLSNSQVMSSLDLSPLLGLTQLVLSNNDLLASVNLKTTSTATINFVQINNNPLLTCVEVDAGIPLNGLSTWSQSNGAIFNEDCTNPVTYVPDDNFEAFLEANSMGNGIPNDDKVSTNNINTVTILDVSNQSISDLTGIEDFIALVELNATSNTLANIDVSNNIVLEKLILNDNILSSIDISKNTALKQLWVRKNNLTILDVSKNSNLEWLVCSENTIQNLNLSLNSSLSFIELHTNDLRTLNLKNISTTSLSFNAQLNSNLTCIEVDNPTLWTTNFSAQIDTTASFNADCSYPTTNVPDAAFENYLETHDRNGNLVTLGNISSMGNGVAADMKVFTHRINTVTQLNVSNVGLSDLTGLEDFRDLENFGAFGGNPGLITADFSNNLKLKRITFTFMTNATSVNFGNLPDLEYIQLGGSKITSVDISGLPNLVEFKDNIGILTSLDTSNNPKLKILNVYSNQITTLDLSTNNQLERLFASNNKLTSLNIANATNNLITTNNFDITNNPNLTCIKVTDITYAIANWTSKDSQHVFSGSCVTQQLTYVPDNNLEAYLETHDRDGNVVTLGDATSMGNGIANDDYVFTNRINTVTILRVNGLSIADMTGIEDFLALQVLDAHNNAINTIDVSSLTALYHLSVAVNPINTLDVTSNSNLRILEVNDTNLANLNVTSNPLLEILKIDDTSLTTIDTSQNPKLKTLSTENTPLTQVDLTNNTLLEFLELRDNALTSLDISNNTALVSFVLTGSPIATLNLSSHTKLIELRLNNNASLNQLNLKNGANTNIPTASFDITNNPNLTCIEVNDVTYATTSWTNKDMQHVYNTNCNYPAITLIPDSTFEQILINQSIDSDGVLNGQVYTADINTITSLVITSSGITDLTGLQDFIALTYLDLTGNNITTIDVSKNVLLDRLDVSNNNLTSIDISSNTRIKTLFISNNKISNINFGTNNVMLYIRAENNLLEHLDVSSMGSLQLLDLRNNLLKSLNVANSNNGAIISSRFNILGNTSLDCVQVSDLNYANTTWVNKETITSYSTDCSTTWTVMTNPTTTTALLAITGLDADNDGNITIAEAAAYTGTLNLSGSGITDVEGLQAFTNITTLDISGNGITDLSPLTSSTFTVIAKSTGATKTVAKNTTMALQNIILNNNNFEVIDLGSLTNLKVVKLNDNANLVTVNMQNGTNANITEFNSENTPNLSCILVDDPNAAYLTTWTKDSKNTFVANEAQCRSEVLSIDNFDITNALTLYPNPVKDYLNIKLSNQLEIKNIKIYNMIGKMVNETKNLEVDFTKMAKGIYLLKIITNKGITTKKIIKE